jgi:1-acyl-sn-glycerol-3-phosphate acyltransferase
MTTVIIIFTIATALLAHLYVHKLPTNAWSFLLSLFYKNIHFIGDKPESKDIATIVVANHANAFIDPFALEVALNRQLLRTVRADWLEHWLVKWLIRVIGAVPISRFRKDRNDKNMNSFRVLYNALNKGKWVVIFPEGESHNRSKLKPFKKGTAHIAEHYMLNTGKPVRVIQLAIHYSDKSKLNSNIWVSSVKETVYQPTDTNFNIHSESENWQRNIQNALPGPMRKAELAKLNWINQSLCDLNQQPSTLSEPKQNWTLNSQLTQLYSWLDVSGLNLSVLGRHIGNISLLSRLLAEFIILIVGLPIAIIGLLTHLPSSAIHYGLTRFNSQAADKWASNAYVIGLPLYPIFWFGLIFFTSPALAMLVMISGLYALFYWKTWTDRKKALFTAFSCFSQPTVRKTVIGFANKTLLPFSPQPTI